MTDFSQSLQLGDHTLDALERQLSRPFTPPPSTVGRRSTRSSSQREPVSAQSSAEEVIEESPTNGKCTAELSRQRSVRERLQIVSTQGRTRRTSKQPASWRSNRTLNGAKGKDRHVNDHENGGSSNDKKDNDLEHSKPDPQLESSENCSNQRTSRSLKRSQLSIRNGDDEGPSPEKQFQSNGDEFDDFFQSSTFSVDLPRSQSLLVGHQNDRKDNKYEVLFDQSDFTLDKCDRTAPDRRPDSSVLSVTHMGESAAEIYSETIFDRAITSGHNLEEAEANSGLEESLRVLDSAEDTLEDRLLNIENVTFSQPLGTIGAGLYPEVGDHHHQHWASGERMDFMAADLANTRLTMEETLERIRDANDDVTLGESFNRSSQTKQPDPPIRKVQKHGATVLASSMSLDQTKDLRLLASWGLPRSVTEEYAKKGIVELFQWQVDCLSRQEVLLEGKNLVYSAPTSAGKTLVSEFLMAKTIAERKLKALFILPFVAVAREKMLYLRDLLAPGGMRVEGFYGGYHPPGGFEAVDLAVCTIEKANSIVNRLLEQSALATLGLVVVDEVHLIGDPSRGYILELLLTKIRFVAQQRAHRIQIVCMSATLPNIDLLARWLEADLYHTDFRPIALVEMIKVGSTLYGTRASERVRELDGTLLGCPIPKDPDHVALLCLETLIEGCSVIVFCPSKDWCEQLAVALAGTLHGLRKEGHPHGELSGRVREQLQGGKLDEVLLQLRNCPAGLDSVLERTVPYGVAFHHAGLTTDERDIVEGSFRDGALRIIVATSTLSSGVNLPARRVIVRTPKFGGRPMSALTYKQMVGRAGRKGRDTLGESVLLCGAADEKIGRELVRTELPPIRSCLDGENYSHLKRAVLEIIAAGSASTTRELESFVNATLYSCEKAYRFAVDDRLLVVNPERNGKPTKNASPADEANESDGDPIAACIAFLLEYEFIRLQDGDGNGSPLLLSATRLGHACLAASLPPQDGFLLFSELQRARQCFVLESELHAVYLVTPYSVAYQWQQIDWMEFLDLWEKLPAASRRVGELVGVREAFMVRAMRGTGTLDYRALQVHKRFYTALALLDLVNEVPLGAVAQRFKCCRGLLQSLQQVAATFAGLVTSFCRALHWTLVQLIVAQFRERLFFGVAHELLDLMRHPSLNGQRARLLHDGGITTLAALASADRSTVEQILHNRTSFEAERLRDDENEFEAARRKTLRNLYLTGKAGVTVAEAARLLIEESRTFLRLEHGLENPLWTLAEGERSPSRSVSPTTIAVKPRSPTQRERENRDQSSVLSRVDSSTGCAGQFHNSLLMADAAQPKASEDRCYPTGLSIREVCASRAAYEQFLATVAGYDCVSVSFGVARDESVPPVDDDGPQIGAHLRQKVPHAAVQFYESPCKRPFAYGDGDLYVAGVAITGGTATGDNEAVVHYVDLQNETTVVEREEKRSLIRTLLHREQLTVTLLDARDQLKVVYQSGLLLLRDGGASGEILASLRDPRVACWLLQTEANDTVLTTGAMLERQCPGLLQAALRWTGQQRPWLLPKWTGHGLNYHSPVEAKQRCAVECVLVRYLMDAAMERLTASPLHACFVDREMPVQLALARAEVDGFPADRRLLGALIARMKACRDLIAEDARQLNGNRRVDFASSRAVAVALRLASAGDGRGRIRTDRQVLERLDCPLAALVIAHRKIESNLARTIEPLYRAICPRTGRIHGRSHCFTSTGRITMHEPNLQTVVKDFAVPGRTTTAVVERFSCRGTFTVSDPATMALLSADFCQLELCVLAHLSQDRRLLEALGGTENGGAGKRDVFRALAARWNQLEREADVSDELRNRTKALVYGVIYGMGVRAMAAELQVDEGAARTLLEQFHATYPGVRRYTERVVRVTRQLGYIETLTGRRRHLPAIGSGNAGERAEAERQAVCTTIQGSAADILKNAIVRMVRNLRKYRDVLDLGAIRLVLHLHDELIYEVPRAQLPKVAKLLRSSMENCAKLSVPLRVKLKAGGSWGTLEELAL